MKMKRILSLVLALLMMVCMLSACKGENKKTTAKGPSDEELIETVLQNTADAICALDMEKAIEYVVDESDLEKTLLSAPSEIEKGIELINDGVAKTIDKNSLFKLIGNDTKKIIKETIAEGLGEGQQAIIDSIEVSFEAPDVDGERATAEFTIKIGGKKFLSLMDGSMDGAMDMVMEYLDVVLEKRGDSYLALMTDTKEIVRAVIDEIINEIATGEKEVRELVATLEKNGGEWLISGFEQ